MIDIFILSIIELDLSYHKGFCIFYWFLHIALFGNLSKNKKEQQMTGKKRGKKTNEKKRTK